MMRTHIWALVALLLVNCTAANPVESDAIRGPQSALVDRVFAQFGEDAPGCAVAVDYRGAVVHMDGYGMADLEQGIPIRPHSVFYSGSISKQVVAMAAMLLEHDGAIDLDAAVRTYLPSLPGYGDQISVRQLLHHTSGIRDYFVLFRLAGRFSGAVITEDMINQILGQQRGLNFTPGEQYAYSNSAYFLVSQIVNVVDGRNLDGFAQARIFGPLQMTNSHFQHDHRRLIVNKAHGYSPQSDGAYLLDDSMLDVVGSGGMYTSVHDLILWDRNFQDNTLGGGQDLVDEMQTSGVLNSGAPTGYGLGLKLASYRGLQQVSHGGALAGYRARLARFPEQHFTVAVLCNSSAAKPAELANLVTEIYLGDLLADDEDLASDRQTDSQNKQLTVDAAELAVFGGSYYSGEVDNTLVVEMVEGGLAINGIDALRSNLVVFSETDIFHHSGIGFDLVFERGGDQAITALVYNGPRVSGLRFVKQP